MFSIVEIRAALASYIVESTNYTLTPPPLICDVSSDGIIQEFYEPLTGLASLVIPDLKKRKIHDLFYLPVDFPRVPAFPFVCRDIPDLLEVFRSSLPYYPSRNLFESFDRLYGFHTSLPCSQLSLLSLPDSSILGIIRFRTFVTRFSLLHHQPLLLLDMESKIKGFNNEFLKCFPFTMSETLLDKPIEIFMTPSPFSLLQGKPSEYHRALTGKWKSIHPNTLSTLTPANDSRFEKNEWSVKKNEPTSLSLADPFDFSSNHFKMECSMTLKSGKMPSMMLCASVPCEHPLADYQGYLLGPSTEMDKGLCKKQGNVILVNPPFDLPDYGQQFRLTLLKRDSIVALFINDTLVAGFRDPDPISHVKGFQAFYSRVPVCLTINSLSLFSMSKNDESPPAFNEVRFHNSSDNTYQIHPLPDDATHIANQTHFLYQFNDITPLKKDIRTWKAAHHEAQAERDKYRALALGETSDGSRLLGSTSAMTTIREKALLAAQALVPTLIEGETGTGKEVLARFIHTQGHHKSGPFVKVDCTTLPDSLLESELFGVEKGAYTGAGERRKGKFESAHKGTLFLDEIGNLKSSAQMKLLKFLQDFTVVRLGSTDEIKVDTALITATNANLAAMVRKGLFRSDLFYRLNTLCFYLPPLRERQEDIPQLCKYFIEKYVGRFERSVKAISPALMKKLVDFNWPGNVRELENVIQKAVLFCEGDTLEPWHVDLPNQFDTVTRETVPEGAVPVGDARALRADHIQALLTQHDNNIARAARAAGVTRATFYNKMKRFNIGIL